MMSGCPPDGVFEDWIGRLLAHDQLRRLDAHVDRCAPCRARMVLLACEEEMDEPLEPDEEARAQDARLDVARARSLARLLVARESG